MKQHVVLELGKAYSKIGLAGESQPRAIIPTPELQDCHTHPSGLVQGQTLSLLEWTNILHKLLHRIFFADLRIDPLDMCVNIIESDFINIVFKGALTQLLFDTFRVPAVRYLPACVTCLYVGENSSGLVIDVGYTATRILPVCFGIPIYSAYQVLPCCWGDEPKSGHSNSNVWTRSLTGLPNDETRHDKLKSYASDPLLVQNVKNENFVEETPNTWACLVQGVLQALEDCPVDSRTHVIANVVPCGGMTDTPGFSERFAQELWLGLCKHPSLNTPRLLDQVALATPNIPGFIRQWTGASLCCMLAENFRCSDQIIDARLWKQSGKLLPDWIVPESMHVQEHITSQALLKAATKL